MLIKADKTDLPRVIALYKEVVSYGDNHRFSNWEEGVYPTDDIAVSGIERGCLFFFCEDGVTVGSVILDGNQPDDYKKLNWGVAAADEDILVVHTLCIRPCFTRKGAGGRLLKDIEAYGREKGYKVIRFDTYCDNAPARQMYLTGGFTEVGMTDITVYGKSRLLRCFEKKL